MSIGPIHAWMSLQHTESCHKACHCHVLIGIRWHDQAPASKVAGPAKVRTPVYILNSSLQSRDELNSPGLKSTFVMLQAHAK